MMEYHFRFTLLMALLLPLFSPWTVQDTEGLPTGPAITELPLTWASPSQLIVTPAPTSTLVASNAACTPQLQTFDSVEMVLVPAGCFSMGSEDGDANERPTHEVCFNEPFWIDRFEVTNGQFDRLGGVAQYTNLWTGDNQPRARVTWFEARDFCEGRGARLPTEAEWEYAARGPDNLAYPWGNEFVSANVVYGAHGIHSGYQPGEEGEDQRREGSSWVGAYDMIGNALEWVSTIYDNNAFTDEFPYPYVIDDGREDLGRTDVMRVLRGGSFFVSNDDWRATNRAATFPDLPNFNMGFRCALSD